MMVTSPLRARCAIVARSTSSLTEVASSGPCQSKIPGTSSPEVLKLPVGPNTSTEWQSSEASSRPPRPRPARRLVRPTITRPGVGRRTNSRRSSRPPAHTEPCRWRRVCSRPGRWPGARPGRYWVTARTVAAVPPATPPTTVPAEPYRPTGPGSALRTSAGQARAGSLSVWGRCHMIEATSAGDRCIQVCPNARPASWPEAHTSAPAAPVVARPQPISRCSVSVMPGSGMCRPLGGTGGRGSRHIRATPQRQLAIEGVNGEAKQQRRRATIGMRHGANSFDAWPGLVLPTPPGLLSTRRSARPGGRCRMGDSRRAGCRACPR